MNSDAEKDDLRRIKKNRKIKVFFVYDDDFDVFLFSKYFNVELLMDLDNFDRLGNFVVFREINEN